MDPLCIPAPNPPHPILPFHAAFSGPCILTNPKMGGGGGPAPLHPRAETEQRCLINRCGSGVVPAGGEALLGQHFSIQLSWEEQGRQHPVGEMLVIPTTTRFQLQKALLHH